MKKNFYANGILIAIIIMLYACGGSENNPNSNSNNQKADDAIEAVFVSASCFEGDCDYEFKLKDGSKIDFFASYSSENPDPSIDYDLFDQEELASNKKWIGKTFIIKYKFVEKGKWGESGELLDCNKIIDIKLK